MAEHRESLRPFNPRKPWLCVSAAFSASPSRPSPSRKLNTLRAGVEDRVSPHLPAGKPIR